MAFPRKSECTHEEWQRILEWYRERDRRYREAGRLRRRNPEKERERARLKHQRAKADPERHALLKARYHRKDVARRATAGLRERDNRLQREARAHRKWLANGARLMAEVRAEAGRRGAADSEDIVCEALLALLDRRARTIPEAISLGRKAHYAQFNQFGTVSLDTEMPGGGGTFLGQLADPSNTPIEELLGRASEKRPAPARYI